MDGSCASLAGRRLSILRRGPSPNIRLGRTSVRTFASEGSRRPWEFGRFLKTVLFFNDPLKNFLESFKAPTPEVSTKSAPVEAPTKGTLLFGNMASMKSSVLVLGAESNESIIQMLVKNGMAVRACAQNVDQVKQALEQADHSPDAALEIVKYAEDMSADRLQAAAVMISGTLAPYLKLLRSLLLSERTVYMPSTGAEGMTWGSLDDVVMGGCSQSQLTVQRGKGDTAEYAAVFSGNITSANNGGFASVRTKNIEPKLDFTGFDGVKIKVKGDGQRYKFMLRTSADWDSTSYCKSFDTGSDWQEIYLSFKDFIPVFRAKTLSPPPPLELDSIHSLQLMLSKFEYDGDLNPSIKMGRFELPIESISLYKATNKVPRVVLIDGSDDDQETLKELAQRYTIVQSDPDQEVPMKDSTFVQFCVASLSEQGVLGSKFTEKERSPISAERIPFDQLKLYFSKK